MTATPRPLVAGNWKMNGLRAQRAEFEVMVKDAPGLSGALDLLVCPPATLWPILPSRHAARASLSGPRIAMPRRAARTPATYRRR